MDIKFKMIMSMFIWILNLIAWSLFIWVLISNHRVNKNIKKWKELTEWFTEDQVKREADISRKLRIYVNWETAIDKMSLQEYQSWCLKTSDALGKGEDRLIIAAMGVAGEAGEVAEKMKKMMRDNGKKIDEDFCFALSKEIGDVMWYCAVLAAEIGYDLQEVAVTNIKKVESRLERGVVAGNGDNR